MSIVLLVSVVIALLALREEFPTPAHEFKDNVDFLPVGKWYLLGQQLSAIAAAGPIVGPIVAGMWFGWFPTLLCFSCSHSYLLSKAHWFS